MDNKLRVPKVLHVGYQERPDTYTKQLAYVVYEDEKGKRRKETSWLSWTSDDIPRDKFDNEPTEGFVLNRAGGGGRSSYSWDARNEFVRVWDPRNFEFEISLTNLLFILQECTSTKGKGLEGEFVYAWSGTTLVLLPVGCTEYTESVAFTDMKSMKVTKKDMVEGHTYQFKDMEVGTYLGRHACKVSDGWNHKNPSWMMKDPDDKRHIFRMDTEDADFVYRFEKGFTKLAKAIDKYCHADFADMHQAFLDSMHCQPAVSIQLVPTALVPRKQNDNHYGECHFIIKDKGVLYLYQQQHLYGEGTHPHYVSNQRRNWDQAKKNLYYIPESELEDYIKQSGKYANYRYHYHHLSNRPIDMPEVWLGEVHKDVQVYTVEYILKSNKTERVPGYVKKR